MIGVPIFILYIGALAAIVLKPKYATVAGCAAACAGCVAIIPLHLLFSPKWAAERMVAAAEILFLLPIAFLGVATALYAAGYLSDGKSGKPGPFWLFFNIMIASMAGVATFDAPLPFLLAWEAMGVSSAALVAYNRKSPESMRATWVYLVACHACAAFLVLMFAMRAAGAAPVAVFALAVAGFGIKSGFAGLHSWMPEAYPAAPAPASAFMSGAMVNLGVFGILKFGLPAVSFGSSNGSGAGWALLVLGIAGALSGVLFALPQKNLKKLLAFSSVENVGIILVGLGLGILGLSHGITYMAAFGLTGAALHVINHSLLKSALFMGAGAVQKAAGTTNLDELGGLMKRLPATGAMFTFNSVGISAMPPLNGFVGELFIFLAAFQGIIHGGKGALLAGCALAAVSLALSGGLAAAAFTKAAGAAFLGETRLKHDIDANAVTPLMSWSTGVLCTISLLMATAAPLALHFASKRQGMTLLAGPFLGVFTACALMAVMAAAILLVRFRLLPRSGLNIPGPTWDCGYAKPTARMAYTGTAFTQPIADLFATVLRPIRHLVKPSGLFPTSAASGVDVNDAVMRYAWAPFFRRLETYARKLHSMQSGHLHVYVLAMVVAVMAMIAWAILFHVDPPALHKPAGPAIQHIHTQGE